MFDTLINRLLSLADTMPDAEAVIFRKERLTYAELLRKTELAAGNLFALGVRRGDRVLYLAVSKPDAVVTYLAIQYLGAVCVPVDKNGTSKNLLDLYQETDARLLVTAKRIADAPESFRIVPYASVLAEGTESPAAAGPAEGTRSPAAAVSAQGIKSPAAAGSAQETKSPAAAVSAQETKSPAAAVSAQGIKSPAAAGSAQGTEPPAAAGSSDGAKPQTPPYQMPDEECLAEIIFTTGTTGRPKGVMLSYRAVYHILKNTADGIGIRKGDREIIPLPLHHSLALRNLRAVLYTGAAVILQNGFAFATELEKNIDEHRATGLVAVPLSMELLREQMQERFYPVLDRLDYIEIGAGSLTVEQRKRLCANLHHVRLNNTWGSSETGGALFTDVRFVTTEHPDLITAIGKPLPGIEVCALDESGKEVLPTQESPGHLCLKGEMILSGYWNRSELTKESIRDGWLITNDMVYFRDGYVFMLGRSDDIINVGGEKVSPIEIENTACEYPSIKECACIGVPDEENGTGQVPALYLATSDPAFSEQAMRTWLASRMERYKIPVYYRIVDAVPRNQMQKLDRRALRRMWDAKNA